MAGKDKGGREVKKPKKDAKKAFITTVPTASPPEVEVIRKKRKSIEEE
jgi:hypothetical protein